MAPRELSELVYGLQFGAATVGALCASVGLASALRLAVGSKSDATASRAAGLVGIAGGASAALLFTIMIVVDASSDGDHRSYSLINDVLHGVLAGGFICVNAALGHDALQPFRAAARLYLLSCAVLTTAWLAVVIGS